MSSQKGGLGKVIQALRESRQMSQRTLAEHAGVTPGYIAQLEMGIRDNPTASNLRRLAEALNVPITELIGGMRMFEHHEWQFGILPVQQGKKWSAGIKAWPPGTGLRTHLPMTIPFGKLLTSEEAALDAAETWARRHIDRHLS